MAKRINQLAIRLFIGVACLLLSGCFGAVSVPGTSTRPAVVTQPEPQSPQPESIPANIPEPNSPVAIPPRQTDVFHGPTAGGNKQVDQNPAVVSLLDRSYRLQQEGDLPGAASTVERGMRIAPQDAALWQRLAQIRMQQGLFNQAIEVAKKSTSLGQGMYRLIGDNWLLIARAHELLGDLTASRLAQQEASRYQR